MEDSEIKAGSEWLKTSEILEITEEDVGCTVVLRNGNTGVIKEVKNAVLLEYDDDCMYTVMKNGLFFPCCTGPYDVVEVKRKEQDSSAGLKDEIVHALAVLRARPESRRGPFIFRNDRLDEELSKHNLDWRQVRIDELKYEIAQLEHEQRSALKV